MSWCDYGRAPSWRSYKLTDLVGKTFTKVIRETVEYNDAIVFSNETERYSLFHSQDCCENVYIEDVIGDPSDLENTPIIVAEERSSENPNGNDDCCAWTFYELRTIKGSVTIRFYGESNGYYSIDATLHRWED